MTQIDPTPKREGFWRRQWAGAPTWAQKIFDGLFGIVAPILCFVFDPYFFRGSGPCFQPPLGRFAVFAYVAVGLGVGVLSIWLIGGQWIKRGVNMFAGIFFAGALFASLIGLALLPFSLFGLLLMGLGVLGFIPFVTAWVYWRNARRAWRIAREHAEQRPARPTAWRLSLAALGLILVLGIPAFAQWLTPPPLPISAEVAQACATND